MRRKLSALVPCGNEEHNIEAVLESVKWCDEILLVDSLSTDRTIELSRRFSSRIIQREYINSASQKNWAIPQAAFEWVLLVDADERVTLELRKEIEEALSQDEIQFDAFWIGRKNFFMGKEVRFSGWQRDKVIRLFKRDLCRYEEKHVHSEIVVNGKIGRLKNKLLHFTFKDIDHFSKKMDRYSEWGAMDAMRKEIKPNAFHFVVKPAIRFMKHYLWNLGILDGKIGWTIAQVSAKGVRQRYVKLKAIIEESNRKQ